MTRDADAAAELLRQTGVDFICYCCMASSIVKGWDWERRLLAQLAGKAGKGIASANSALCDALSLLGARRLAVITPYPATLNALLPNFFATAGFQVTSMAGPQINEVAAVRAVSPESIRHAARSLPLHEADALCLLATDMETFPLIALLERELGLPVLSNNQAMLWSSLRALAIDAPIEGLGELLRRKNRS
jgi:maleate isomerase